MPKAKKILSTPVVGLPPAKSLDLPAKTVAGGATTVLVAIPVPRNTRVVIDGYLECYDATGNKCGFFKVNIVARNNAGTTALVGSANITTNKEDSDFAVTAAANNTDDTIEISGAADSANETKYGGFLEWTIKNPAL